MNETRAPEAAVATALRPDTRPLEWSLLLASQQAAFVWLMGGVAAAVDALDRRRGEPTPACAGRPARLPFTLDKQRASQVLFLSGARGSGKSTLLLSVLKALDEEGYLPTDNSAYDSLRKVRCRTVWLEPLDMEPLAGSTNLLAAILARIEAAVQPLDAREWTPGSGVARIDDDLLGPTPEYLRPIQELRRLQTDVALTWDGNLPQRGGQIDPDVFALEVLRAERARLNLPQRLRDVLDGLARQMASPCGVHDPLVVLPVDDYDLNPGRCLDLLRLLRLVSVPRMLVLVLGNMEVAETVLAMQTAREFSEATGGPSGPHPAGGREGDPDISAMAASIAANALRKLVPPGQVIQIAEAGLGEALAFRPSNAADSLVTLLDATAVPGPQKRSLSDHLLLRPSSGETSGDTASSPYSAAACLMTTPRRLTDLWQQLNNFRAAKEAPVQAIVDILASETRRAVAEDPHLPSDLRRQLLAAIRRNFVGAWELQTGGIHVSGRTSQPIRVGASAEPTVEIRLLDRWQWRVTAAESGGGTTAHDIGDSAGGQSQVVQPTVWLTLLHDVLADCEPSGLFGPPLVPLLGDSPWAAAVWTAGRDRDIPVPWPRPEWRTFREFDRLAHAWHRAVERAPSESPSVLAFRWIAGATAIVGERPVVCDGRWDELAAEVASLLTRGGMSRERELAHSWVAHLALLFAPETGITSSPDGFEACRPLWERTELRDFWKDESVAARIREIRGQRLRAFTSAGLLDWAVRFGAIPPQYDRVLRDEWPILAREMEDFPQALMGSHASGELIDAWDDVKTRLAEIAKTHGTASSLLEATELEHPLSELGSALEHIVSAVASPGALSAEASSAIAFAADLAQRLTALAADLRAAGGNPNMRKALDHPINSFGGGVLRPWLTDHLDGREWTSR